MPVITTETDAEQLTLTIVAEFEASPEQVWDVWQDPRKLERWWGPPTYPASFTRHEFSVGGQSRYHMTGPSGDKARGWWRIDLLDRPNRIEFANGLAGDDGEPEPGDSWAPTTATFETRENGTRMAIVTNFVDLAQMEKMVGMGMPEGMSLAVGQIDALLSELAAV
jgi:uncharacterized protein YndB with AHSA1/START domain